MASKHSPQHNKVSTCTCGEGRGREGMREGEGVLLHRGFSKRWAVTDQRLWQHLQDKYSHHPERKTVHNWIAAQTSQTHSLTDTMCPPRPCAASAHSSTALSWGYPTPVFLRVVQTDPTTRSNTCFHNTQSTWSPLQHTVYLAPSTTHSLYLVQCPL